MNVGIDATMTNLAPATGKAVSTIVENRCEIAQLIVREDADVEKVARELNNMVESTLRGDGVR
jgi:hypothetical protein